MNELQQELLPPEGEEPASAALVVQETANKVARTINEAEPAVSTVDSKAFKYSLPELRKIGEIMFQSGMFKDLRSVQQAMVKLLAGAEMGYGPFQSLRAYHVIEGKPVETSGEISARIKRSPRHDYRHYWIDVAREPWDPVKQSVSTLFGCVIVVRLKKAKKWEEQEPVVFTLEDAKLAGLAGKTNWKSYPRAMLFARTITEAARAHCADLFGGPIYTPEELGAEVAIDANGDMAVTGTLSPAPADNGNGEPKADVDNAQTRKAGIEAVTRFASNRKIPDTHRHEIAQAFFGHSSSKELSTPELRKLYALLVKYVGDRAKEADPEVFAAGFDSWLEYHVALEKEAAAGG